MKKLLIILIAIFAVNLPSLAVITPEESMSEEYILNHGHSGEMSRLIDLQNAQINDTETKYVKPVENWQNLKRPKFLTEKRVGFIRKFFMYMDPSADDERFMQNDTHYTNRTTDM